MLRTFFAQQQSQTTQCYSFRQTTGLDHRYCSWATWGHFPLILWLQTVSGIKPGVCVCVCVCVVREGDRIVCSSSSLSPLSMSSRRRINTGAPSFLVNNLERHTHIRYLSCPSFCLFSSLWKTPETKLCLFKWQPVCWTKLLIWVHTCTAKVNRKQTDYLTQCDKFRGAGNKSFLRLDGVKTFNWFFVLMWKGCIRSERFRLYITNSKPHFTLCSY